MARPAETDSVVTALRPGLGQPRDDTRLRLHDVRNVAAGLALTAEEMARSTDPNVVHLGRRIERIGARIEALCGADAGARPDAARGQSLAALLADVLDVAGATADAGTSIEVECEEDLAVPGEAQTVFRVLLNLAANAVSAVNRVGGGMVHIAARRVETLLLIDVCDEGPGLLSARSGAAERKGTQPSGMGLLIAETLTERLGGRLEVVETSRLGTTLRLAFLDGGCEAAAAV